MKKRVCILVFVLSVMLSVQAQFAKPLKKKNDFKRAFSLGITGSYAANDLIYSSVTKSSMHPVFDPTFGLAAEWNTMPHFSVGLDVSYAMRGGQKTFNTEFQTSYSSTTFAHVKYDITMNGIDLRIPLSFYFGDEGNLRPYVYLAPRLSVWTGGKVSWERTYDDPSFPSKSFESRLNEALMLPFDLSAMAGVGLCAHLKTGRRALLCKLDLGYGVSVLSNFSQGEVNGEVAFEGWGDIAHETLGQRRLQNLEVRLAILLPLQKPVADACDFNQKPYKSR